MFDERAIRSRHLIRGCRRDDLPLLECFGEYSAHREIFLDTFARHERGEVVMLAAEADRFPVGQIWIELGKKHRQSIGVLWALRIMERFQGLGIGSQLILAAEGVLIGKRYPIAEISVGKENQRAKRLYENLGYRTVYEQLNPWEYTRPDGTHVWELSDEWVMHKTL